MLPPIHPGLYPPSPSPSLKNTTHNCSHVIPSPPKPNTLHKDFRQMNDLIDYEELCHTVETQLKHDRLNPPQPIRHTLSASHKQLPSLPSHQAYMLPGYSHHVAKNQDNTPIGAAINIDSDSNVLDNHTLDPIPNLLPQYDSDSRTGNQTLKIMTPSLMLMTHRHPRPIVHHPLKMKNPSFNTSMKTTPSKWQLKLRTQTYEMFQSYSLMHYHHDYHPPSDQSMLPMHPCQQLCPKIGTSCRSRWGI